MIDVADKHSVTWGVSQVCISQIFVVIFDEGDVSIKTTKSVLIILAVQPQFFSVFNVLLAHQIPVFKHGKDKT